MHAWEIIPTHYYVSSKYCDCNQLCLSGLYSRVTYSSIGFLRREGCDNCNFRHLIFFAILPKTVPTLCLCMYVKIE